jgi:hypothetical protein
MRRKISASLEPDFADNTSATAAPTPNESNWEGRGGCLGFFENLFSLIHPELRKRNVVNWPWSSLKLGILFTTGHFFLALDRILQHI